MSASIHPDSPLIDGAIPRTEAERCSILLDYALNDLNNKWKHYSWEEFPTELYREYFKLEDEYRQHYDGEYWEWWNELEDDIIDLINKLLPEDAVCLLNPDDPGTVVIWNRDDEF